MVPSADNAPVLSAAAFMIKYNARHSKLCRGLPEGLPAKGVIKHGERHRQSPEGGVVEDAQVEIHLGHGRGGGGRGGDLQEVAAAAVSRQAAACARPAASTPFNSNAALGQQIPEGLRTFCLIAEP